METVEAPLTEARTVSAIQASMAGMSKDGLDAIFEAAKKAEAKAKVEDDEEEEDDEGDEDEGDVEMEGKARKSLRNLRLKTKTEELKQTSKKKVKADDGSEGDVMEKDAKFKEDLDALVKDEDTLSEGFKEKACYYFRSRTNIKNHC